MCLVCSDKNEEQDPSARSSFWTVEEEEESELLPGKSTNFTANAKNANIKLMALPPNTHTHRHPHLFYYSGRR